MPSGGVNQDTVQLVNGITYGTDPDVEKWYVYNANGEIQRYNSIMDTVTFYYAPDSIRKVYGNSSGQWQTSVTYFLDKNGRADSSVIRGENDEIISTYRFRYDSDGYLILTLQNVLTSGNSYKQTFRYQDGNLAEITQYTFDGKPFARYFYDYYPAMVNPLNINLHHLLEDFLSADRLGKGNISLIKSMVNVTTEGDTLSYLRFVYPENKSPNSLLQVEEDVLNENRTERTYHFSDIIIR